MTLLGCAPADPDGSDSATDPTTTAPTTTTTGVLEFHCGFDADCPEVSIASDPDSGDFFHGFGDPSLTTDADGALWLSYSWLDAVTSAAGVDTAVRTHLARSDDQGLTWTFVTAPNEVTADADPVTGDAGWRFHEVSTLAARATGGWEALWLDYFEPAGDLGERSQFRFARAFASTPDALGPGAEAAFAGTATLASEAGVLLGATLPALADCAIFTEPDLFTEAGTTWLAATCIVFGAGGQDYDATRLVLLKEKGDGWDYVGTLLDGADAAALGGDTFEQVDLARARDGALLLLGTPIRKAEDPQHQGCTVLVVEDLASAEVRRDAAGLPAVRARLTGDGNVLGPGLCTYDAANEGGVLMVLTDVDLGAPDVAFSLRATGVHP